LAEHVKSLRGVGSLVKRFIGRPEAGDGYPRSWQEALIRVCSKVEIVSLYLDGFEHTKKLAEVLQSRSTVKNLKLMVGGPSRGQDIFATWANAYKLDKALKQPQLTVQVGPVEQSTPDVTRPRYSTRRLTLDTSFPLIQSTLAFLPRQIKHLLHLRISFHHAGYQMPPFAPFLAAFAGNRLQTLSISADAVDEAFDDESYMYQLDPFDLPLAFFSAFPHLRTCALKSVTDLSVTKLSLLASSSPRLHTLDLDGSVWTFNSSDFETPSLASRDISQGEQQLIDLLRLFSKLKKVDLGILPLYDYWYETGLDALRAYCESHEVDMTVQGFEEEEPSEEEFDY
jgi:hypothetical protein